MKNLKLWEEYTREEIHSIFSPDTVFTPQAGTWGLHGMIKIPDRHGDWVFLVTLGNQQGDHIFDESITEDGVLSWQSQPRQDFSSDAIESLINHDDRVNNIHLFLRAKKNNPYGYFGKLGYLTHDTERQNPVYFQWQILDWEAPADFIRKVGIELIYDKIPIKSEVPVIKTHDLIVENKPIIKSRTVGVKTNEFRSRKSPDYGLIDSKNKKLGLEGELLVLNKEILYLRSIDRDDLADKVVHISVVEGDGAGYDIKSFDREGSIKFIEVKTTKGSANTSFFISPNELEFSKQKANNYFLYRLYEYQVDTACSKVYILKGNLMEQINITPTQFKAQLI
jgi:hypothetical protein